MTIERIQFRRGTAAEWTAANPVLAVGEPGHEIDTGREKRGDGVTAWNDLAYFAGVGGGIELALSPRDWVEIDAAAQTVPAVPDGAQVVFDVATFYDAADHDGSAVTGLAEPTTQGLHVLRDALVSFGAAANLIPAGNDYISMDLRIDGRLVWNWTQQSSGYQLVVPSNTVIRPVLVPVRTGETIEMWLRRDPGFGQPDYDLAAGSYIGMTPLLYLA